MIRRLLLRRVRRQLLAERHQLVVSIREMETTGRAGWHRATEHGLGHTRGLRDGIDRALRIIDET